MKALITLVVLALLVWGGYVLFRGTPDVAVPGTDNGAETYLTPAVYQTPNTSNSTATATPGVIPVVKTFNITGSNFAFNPATIEVNKGDRVRIVFQSQGTHDWVIDAFNARTKVLQTGQSETIEFTASQSGSFEYYCSVGSHRQMGMKGTLVVK